MLSSLLFLNAMQSQAAVPKRQQDLGALALLAALMAGSSRKKPPADPERKRLRGLLLRDFCTQCYLIERNHLPKGPTAELTTETLNRLRESLGREIFVKELSMATLRQFRAWLAIGISKGLSPATANRHLRQLRAIWNHGARWRWRDSGKKWRIIKPPPPMEFFPEPEIDVLAWTTDDLLGLEKQARSLTGLIGGVPSDIFWTAWVLLLEKIGCRITAMMLASREDYDPKARTILLRRENQKQKKDQRIALSGRAAIAIERLLESHSQSRIFGCWPYDPPVKSTGRRHWNVLTKHFYRQLVVPVGLDLQRYVKTRQFRRTAATIVEENGGNAQELLGHADRKTTERYKDRRRRPICRQSLLIPDPSPQRLLFDK